MAHGVSGGGDVLPMEWYEHICESGELFVQKSLPTCRDGASRHYELNPQAGRGWMDLRQFDNGLVVGRSSFELSATYANEYTFTPDTLGFGLMLAGHMQVQQPSRGWTGRMREGSMLVRNGDLGRLRYESPAHCMHCGVSIDMPVHMVDALREEGLGLFTDVARGACALLSGSTEETALMHRIGWRMLALDARPSTLGQLEVESLALDLLLKVLAMRKLVPRSRRCQGARWRAAMDDAVSILHAEWSEPITIASLARRVGVNECYLKSLFRERTGDTIAGYLRQLRMQHARTLIESGEHTVQQVALLAGYVNPSHFAKAFRRAHGMLPSHLWK